jgi:chromosome segregation ATPase
VTPEGDLITVDGIRVAHPDGATPAMVEAAAAALEAAEIELSRHESLLQQAKRAFDAAREQERAALEHLESVEARLSGLVETLGRLERTVTAQGHEHEGMQERRSALEAELKSRAEQRERLAIRLEALEGEEAERQRAWEELVRRREAVASGKETARASWQEAASTLRGIVERREMVVKRLAAVDATLTGDAGNPVDPAAIARLEGIERAARRTLEVLRLHLDALRLRQADLRQRAGATGRRMTDLQRRHE